MSEIVKTLVFLGCTLAFVSTAQAQGTYFKQLPLNDDQERVGILAIAQDELGFIWLGSSDGLRRYDGYSFKLYQHNPADDNSLSLNEITSLLIDHEGIIWIGTRSGGLNRLNPRTEEFTRFRHNPNDETSLGSDEVWDLLEDRHGGIWISAYRGGLNRFDRSTNQFHRYLHDPDNPQSISSNLTSTLFEDRSGMIWVGTWIAGLNRFNPTTGEFKQFLHDPSNPEIFNADRITSIDQDNAGNLWVGTRGGLTMLDPDSWAFQRYREDSNKGNWLRDERISSILTDFSKGLLIGTSNGGLHHFDYLSQSFTVYRANPNDPLSLANDRVGDLFEDRSGQIWVGSHNNVQLLMNSPATHYSYWPGESMSLSTPDVRAVLEGSKGRIWMGMAEGGLNHLDSESRQITHYRHRKFAESTLPSDHITAIYEDPKGYLWVGTWNAGFARFDPQTGDAQRIPYDAYDGHSFNDVCVYTFFVDREGIVWIGARDGGLNRYDAVQQSFEYFTADPNNTKSIGSNTVFTIHEDRDGRLWVGTRGGGLNLFDREDKTFTVFRADPANPESISSDDVRTIYEDDAGFLWIGTNSGGLNRFDPEQGIFERFTTREGLSSNAIHDILTIVEDKIWLRTAEGLTVYDPVLKTSQFYPIDIGVEGTKGTWDASAIRQKGAFIFGGSNGLAILHPDSLNRLQSPPAIALTDFKVFDERWPMDLAASYVSEVTLSHLENFFSFEFAALTYGKPDQNQYRYKLNGFDEQWIDAGIRRFASYTNVPPGRYWFNVQGSSGKSGWNKSGASVHLIITPPFWQRGWFYLVGGLFLTGMAGFIGYVVHLRNVKQRSTELIRLVEERTQALVEAKEITEAQAAQLRELNQTKSRFFAGITHEFRTPLTLILGPLSDLLKGRFGSISGPIQKQHLLMKRHADQLLRLINELLDLSRLEAGTLALSPSEGDLNEYVRQIVRSFESQAERDGILLNFSGAADAISAAFDPVKMEHIVQNLLSNALKFTSKGGKVWVSIRYISEDNEAAAEISVKDTGPGIAPEDIDRIFDRFYQSQKVRIDHLPGAGIGLALAKELVELHNGNISVVSHLGLGSTFKVRIPLNHEMSDSTRHVTEDGLLFDLADSPDSIPVTSPTSVYDIDQESAVVLDNSNILIVDDNPELRAFLKQTLQPDFAVTEAGNGIEALAEARKSSPDLIVSDVMMPDMDGFELCETIKQDPNLGAIPFIMLTALTTDQDELAGLSLGADDYIGKPFHPDILRQRIRNLIQARKHPPTFEALVSFTTEGFYLSDPAKEFMAGVTHAICSHLGDSHFGVQRLAEELGMSRRKLERRLSESAGVAPAELIRRTRLTNASHLLKTRRYSIAEVAYMVGFKSPAHFSTAFREAHGMSPSTFMEQGA